MPERFGIRRVLFKEKRNTAGAMPDRVFYVTVFFPGEGDGGSIPSIAYLQYIVIASLTNAAVPGPPTASMLAVKRSSAVYI